MCTYTQFGGDCVLSIINIYTPAINKWEGHSKWIKAILYFERIIEQTKDTRKHYNYGRLTDKNRSEIQQQYLIPLLEHQVQRHKASTSAKLANSYIYDLFSFFCGSKTFIDLSCIKKEHQDIIDDLKEILFPPADNGDKYAINSAIFPNLQWYINADGDKVKPMDKQKMWSFAIRRKQDATFKDPKQEVLKNKYHALKVAEWNDLLRKSVLFSKSREAKVIGLKLKQVVGLKLYTDFIRLNLTYSSKNP